MCPLRKVQLISQQATSRIHRRRKCESSSPNYLRPIHILFWEYLGVMYMFQTYKPIFLQEKEPATLSHGLTVAKQCSQFDRKYPKCLICLRKPKSLEFLKKKLSLGVRSPRSYIATKISTYSKSHCASLSLLQLAIYFPYQQEKLSNKNILSFAIEVPTCLSNVHFK